MRTKRVILHFCVKCVQKRVFDHFRAKSFWFLRRNFGVRSEATYSKTFCCRYVTLDKIVKIDSTEYQLFLFQKRLFYILEYFKNVNTETKILHRFSFWTIQIICYNHTGVSLLGRPDNETPKVKFVIGPYSLSARIHFQANMAHSSLV